jgi:hypothetical protein
MNINIINKIHYFYDECLQYQFMGNTFAYVIYLNDLAMQWKNVDACQQEIIGNEIEKIIIKLMDKISSSMISIELINTFSDIIVTYMDQISNDEKKIDELANMFNKMNVTYKIPKDFEKEIFAMNI